MIIYCILMLNQKQKYSMEEIWKDIKGYEGLYKVSTFGRIKSFYFSNKGIVLRQSTHRKRYKSIGLTKNKVQKRFLVHRLVAKAFIPNPENKSDINHIDGNGFNNCVPNLEWATRSENHKHAFRTGLKTQRGEINSNTNLTRNDVLDIRNTYRLGCFTQQEIAESYGITNGQVSNIITKRSWAHI